MTSEIRTNTLKNRVGLGTISLTSTGPIVSGITTLKDDVEFHGSSDSNTIKFDKSDNSLKFIDGAKAKFGTSNDLEVYHDGSHSHIREIGTGDLRLRSSKIQLMNENSQEYFVGTSGGSVELYHNDNLRLTTTDDGITVDKGITVNGIEGGDAQIRLRADQGDDNNDMFRFVVSDGGTGLKIQGYDGSFQSRITVSTNGNIGINETTPEAKFEVDGRIRVLDNNDATPSTGKGLEISYFNTADYADILSYDRGGGAYKDLHLRGNNLVFKTGTSERLRIDSSGRVMIGNTAASSFNASINQLVVGNGVGNQGMVIYTGASHSGNIIFNDVADGTYQGGISYKHGSGASDNCLKFYANADERLRITSDGKFGVGTNANIDERIHFENAGNITVLAECNTSGSGANAAYRLKSADSSSDWYIQTGNVTSGGLRFYSGSERLRITSGGQVNIGGDYTQTNYPLQVNQGTDENRGISIKNDEVGLNLGAHGSGHSYGREFSLNATRIDNGSLPILRLGGQGGIKLCSDLNTERLNIASDGTLTLKNNSGMMIDLQSSAGTGSAWIEFSDTNGTRKGYFGYGSGSSEKVYWVQAKAANMSMYSNGNDRFEVQSDGTKIVKNGRLTINSTFIDFSGSISTPSTAAAIYRPADNTLAFSTANEERLRITSDGNVGINETNPIKLLSIVKSSTASYNASALGGADNHIVRIHNKNGTDNTGVNNHTGLEFVVASGANSVGQIGLVRTGNNIGDIFFKFRTGSSSYAERLRITSGGELLLNETVSGGACRIGMSFGNAVGNYLELGGTQRAANGLNKVFVFRHGYWGGSREVASFGVTTTSSTGGSGRGYGALSFITGSSGNGDSGSDAEERMRIEGWGLVKVGNSFSGNSAGRFQVIETRDGNQYNDCNAYFETASNDWNIKTNYNRSGTHYHMYFLEQGSGRGSISGSDGSNVTFNQGSDYRWKENIVNMTGTEGIDICKKLKPRKYNWIQNREETGQINTIDGFIAHEVEEAGVTGAVTGEKDAVNEDGSIKGQMLDYGQMTPVLAAAIKGLIDKVETLEAEVAALKS